jgi:divalent metal cation (Fe/Co/Zn/Cd) transporter
VTLGAEGTGPPAEVIPQSASRIRDRKALVRRGIWLSAATIAYNSLEGGVSVIAGLLAGSIVLVGFGIDSVIEVVAGLAALWRLRADVDPARRVRVERQTLRLVGTSFLLLAAYVAYEAISALATHAAPSRTALGILIAATSLIVMPLLAWAKGRVAIGLASDALASEARQTVVCTYLSGIVLLGLGLNASFGWWWADPVAALAMVPLIAREGVEVVRGHSVCAGACGDV